MSYLRGPLTRNQIKFLMDPRRDMLTVPATPSAQPQAEAAPVVSAPLPAGEAASPSAEIFSPQESTAPVLPPSINQVYAPVRGGGNSGDPIIYKPMLLGSAQMIFANNRINLRKARDITLVTPITDSVIPVDWQRSEKIDLELSELENNPVSGSIYAEIPGSASESKNYTQWSREFVDWLYRNEVLELMQSHSFKEISEPGESERDFRVRLQQNAREHRDREVDKLRKKYASRINTMEERVRRAEQTVSRHEDAAKQHKLQTAISIGSTVLGSFLGKSPVSATTLGRATTSARGAGRVLRSQEDIKRAEETLETHRQQLQELEEEFKRETDLLEASFDPLTEELEILTVKPLKKDISLRLFALAWLPFRRSPTGISEKAW